MDQIRIDKWLWAARFFKTRSLAADAVDTGRVRIDGQRIKPARVVKEGETYDIDNGSDRWEVVVKSLSDKRGPAPVARGLYEETADSLKRRDMNAEARRLHPEPGSFIRGGRPTKRDRRLIDRAGDDS